MSIKIDIQHFLLTRFNILLWQKDKEGCKIRTIEWLEHRFSLFEKYCLPSVANQTCKNFEWIILFDSKTPEQYRHRIERYKQVFPQLIPIFVEPEKGHLFAQIFRIEVIRRLRCNRVITSYLDNDDALDMHFVDDLQKRVFSLEDGTFVFYEDGFQFYTDHKYLMRIHYPKNHFVSVVEKGDPLSLKSIYGYGSHYYIDKIDGAKIEYVKNQPLWCEVIHEKNMGNDAYFLSARMIHDEEILRRVFNVNEAVKYGMTLYLLRFLPRYTKTFVRRTKYFFWGRHW